MADLAEIEKTALAELSACADEPALRAWHGRHFGKQGVVPVAMQAIGKIPPAERKAYGQQVNQLKEQLTAAHEAALARVQEAALAHSLATEKLDVTLPGRTATRG